MRLPYDGRNAIGRELLALGPDVAAAILLTLQAGWARIVGSPGVQTDAREVVLTEQLRDGMRAALNSGQFPWSKDMIIAPGTESRSRQEQLIPDGRTDIPIYLIRTPECLGEHDPHAIIECKRITGSDTRLCREYVVEGVDRFKTGKYGENHAIGFMAGYLLAGDDTAAVTGINAVFERRSRAAEQLVTSDVVVEPGFWRSRHPRELPREPIDLHHAFFAIAPTPPQKAPGRAPRESARSRASRARPAR